MKTIIIGVGRRGGDIVAALPENVGAPLHYADTDTDDLERRPESARLRLGSRMSDEEFVRNDPSFSFEAAMADRQAIEARLREADVAILVAGLGGGTGAGGSKAIALIARDLGMPVIALVTRPFELEGEVRVTRGRRAFRDLTGQVDLTVAFYQDLLVPLVEKATRLREVVSVADEVIGNAVKSLVAFLDGGGRSDLNDLLQTARTGLFSYGISEQRGGVIEAADFAFGGPFLEGVALSKTRGLAISVLSRDPVDEADLERALKGLREKTSESARLFISKRVEPNLDHELEFHLHLTGDFGDPHTSMGDFWVPGPTG